jgi:hypothetical protein
MYIVVCKIVTVILLIKLLVHSDMKMHQGTLQCVYLLKTAFSKLILCLSPKEM